MSEQHCDQHAIALALRLLGVAFYYAPTSSTFQTVLPLFSDLETVMSPAFSTLLPEQGDAAFSTLDGDTLSVTVAQSVSDPLLSYHFSLLFEGQGNMPAPPWGSYYLDPDHLLFAESMQRYHAFLQQHQLEIVTSCNEPIDQIGLMVMTLAQLIEHHQFAIADELLKTHLLPWLDLYVEALKQANISSFYMALALILQPMLHALVPYLQTHQEP